MPEAKTSLNELLYDIRRIEESREILTEQKIKAMYRQLMDDLNTYLAGEYIQYADADGRFYMQYLDAQNKRARFLQEVIDNVDSITPQLRTEIQTLIDETYEHTYAGMLEALKMAEKNGTAATMVQDLSVQPDVLNQAVNNNISKLTLPAVLEKHRQAIIYDIQQVLTIGLMNGDRYETMAKRISERVGVSYNKAMAITRTESRRNIESGFMDCAEHIQESMDGSDYIYAATWHNKGDQRVRPQIRRETKKGWKTYWSKNGADHIEMEGKTVKSGDLFKFSDGVTTKKPLGSGYARHDCNCRCFIEYNLMTVEEFERATGKPVTMASLHRSDRELMNQSGIADCQLERTTDSQRFSKNFEISRASNPYGGAVDPVTPEMAKEFKCFIAKNNMAFVAVKEDGDITAVLKHHDYKQRGAVSDLILTARANGGTKMDCYGIDLVNKYERCGYVAVGRVKFNPEFATDPYLLKTRPDIYFLMKNTDDLPTAISKCGTNAYKLSTQADLDKLPLFDDIETKDGTVYGYDRAYKTRDDMLEKQEK